MRLTVPQEVTPSTLIATNVPENDNPEWAAGTYTLGDLVTRNRKTYKCAAATTTDDPEVGVLADPPTWALMGWSNRWRMFTEGIDSLTTNGGSIDVEIQPDELVTKLALFGLSAFEAQVTMTDTVDGIVYDKTIPLTDIGASDWFEWHFAAYEMDDTAIFDSLPPYIGAPINVVIRSSDGIADVSAGRLVVGEERDLGLALFGTSLGLIDFSQKGRDGFGNLIIVPRRIVDRVEFQVAFETENLSYIRRVLKGVSATPVLFSGTEEYDFTDIFAVYRDFRVSVDGPNVSYGSIEVEGF